MDNMYHRLLNMITEQTGPVFLDGGSTIVPMYQGLSIANLPASICRWLGCSLESKQTLIPDVINQFQDEYDQVILLLVDGLSLSLFNTFMDNSSRTLGHAWGTSSNKQLFVPITSIVPSTTSAALTTLWTGTPPIKHGIIGYELFLKEVGCITNMITYSPASFLDKRISITNAGFDPANFLPMPTLGTYLNTHGVSVEVFEHQSIIGSGLSHMLFRDVTCRAYRTESDLWYSVMESLNQKKGGKTYTFIYWSEIDTISHRFGPQHPRLLKEWNTFAYLLGQLFSALSTKNSKTLFLITADHGQISTEIQPGYNLQVHPELTNHLIMNPTGESRLPFIFIKKDHEQDVDQYLKAHWNNQFKMISSQTFIQSGLLGEGEPFQETINRLGNYVVIPKDRAYWWWVNKTNILLGRHGGLSSDEMLVPLFIMEI